MTTGLSPFTRSSSATTPASRAASRAKGLNVEPGSKTRAIAQFTRSSGRERSKAFKS